jgi:structure-specific recognition protein 1
MIIPRGKYSFDLYADFAKLHGSTNDYKILYKDISKCFLLPKPDGNHMAYLIQLKTPLRQGQTLHHFIALQFDKDLEFKVAINLSKEEIKEKYDDKLESEIEGPLYDVLSKLFKNLAKVSILIPGEFKSANDNPAIKCSVKASDGHLYPLKSSIVFIHKPVHYIKHAQIKYVEFSRIGGLGAGMPSSRSFDMTVHKVTGEAVTFAGIDKQEHKNLAAYFKAKNIRTRNVDADNKQRDSESEEEEDSEEVSTKRRAAKKGAAAAEEYDDEEDDESFKDDGSEGSGEGGDDEEMEEEGEDDEDMEDDLDDGIDNDELKALQKENAGIDLSASTRRTRGGARAAAEPKK